MEVYDLIPAKKPAMNVCLAVLSMSFAVISAILTCINVFCLIAAVVFGILWYFFTVSSFVEYEYSYFDGRLSFVKITNKSRRKELETCNMGEIECIVPGESREAMRLEHDSSVRIRDYTSHEKNVPYYVAIVRRTEKTFIIRFEPDQKFLDEIEKKYRQKLTRRAGS